MDGAAPDGVGRRPSIRQGPGWRTLALLAVFSTAMAQQRERWVEPAAVPVRYAEGTVHGFLERAAAIRQEAESLAATVKRQSYQQADSLTAKATNPILKAAAKPAADQLRKQADEKSAGIISEANSRADSVVAAARRQADQRSGAK